MNRRIFLDLPSKADIFEYWKERLFKHGLLIDWCEPSCWVCGFSYGTKYDIRRSDASWDEIYECWERMPLQRCHIVPRSLGGADTVENLFLMCRECHDTAPNTNIPEIFFEWSRSQHWQKREHAKVIQALEAFSVPKRDYRKFMRTMESPLFQEWMQDKIGLHWPQSNYAPRSSRLTPATIVGLVVHYFRQQPHAPTRRSTRSARKAAQVG
ncbi:HNH endonuclease signature motif containing protein [Azovibrio restrictus]|uniref:HNH endonuclease signature motif containing protein n=1 Tax=Azovibrio restrictus TaxID=146938 RepID=UPI00146F9867|nr:HNH endonuclease signature motif containing protein [Azovibrio restrictus]